MSYEILLEHNTMLQENIRRLRDENEYLKNIDAKVSYLTLFLLFIIFI